MYIVAIAWLFVATMAAVAQPNVTAAIVTLLFWGVFPLALFLWIMARRQRRELADKVVHQVVGDGDGANAKPDQ